MKYYLSLLFVVFSMVIVSSCSSDNEENSQNSLIDASYSKVKSQIIGTWLYEAEYKKTVSASDLGGLYYNKLGWNERDPYKSLTFKTDGTLIRTYSSEETLSYILKAEYKYNNLVENYSEYYPFKNGGVILSISSKSYFVDIVNG